MTDRSNKLGKCGTTAPESNLLPEYERIGNTARFRADMPETLRDAILHKYLPVYAYVEGLRAVPCPRARGKGKDEREKLIELSPAGWRVTVDGKVIYDGPGLRLGSYWQVLNEPESESSDASIFPFVIGESGESKEKERNEPNRVGWLYRSQELPNLPGSDSLILVDDLFVRFDDLYVKMAEVFDRATNGTALEQIKRHAGNEAEVLRVALALLSREVQDCYRFKNSKKVNAKRLADAVIEQDAKWWTEGACPLGQRTCADLLRDVFDGNPRKK